jgi:single-stranded DNA-specific DHH superfamily exonuclease
MRRNIPSPQREINDLEPSACFYYALKSVNLKVPLQQVANKFPEIPVAFGDHRGAAGLTLKADDIEAFIEEADLIINDRISSLVAAEDVATVADLSGLKLIENMQYVPSSFNLSV